MSGVYETHERWELARELSGAFLEGPWNAVELAERGAGCLDRWPEWMTRLAGEVVAVHRAPPAEHERELVAFIEDFLAKRPAGPAAREPPVILRWLPVVHHTAEPPTLEHAWPIAAVESVGDLAQRLELSLGQLAWLADVRSLERTVAAERLRNYRYRTLSRRSGLPRVIEAPKARLKEVQRWLLHEILDHIPPHPAAQGFIRGRSVVTHAEVHIGQDAVLRLDLADFFASIAARRIYGIFSTVGYRPAVAHALTGLSKNTIAQAVWAGIPRSADPRLVAPRFWLGRQLATPHLPQGAPTSPALANLAAFGLDRRLTVLATALGLRYSRYADDLTFSGPRELRRRSARVQELVATIAREEGFTVNRGKSALRVASGRQSVCGIVVNVRPNVTRAEYDQLKAILHNAARDGPAAQNRAGVPDLQAHLRGRIAWVASLNPDRGARLARRFADIDWDEARSQQSQ